MWGVVFCEVCNDGCKSDCRMERRSVLIDGDDYGWLCVLKEVLGVQLSMGCGMDCGGCGWKDVGR